MGKIVSKSLSLQSMLTIPGIEKGTPQIPEFIQFPGTEVKFDRERVEKEGLLISEYRLSSLSSESFFRMNYECTLDSMSETYNAELVRTKKAHLEGLVSIAKYEDDENVKVIVCGPYKYERNGTKFAFIGKSILHLKNISSEIWGAMFPVLTEWKSIVRVELDIDLDRHHSHKTQFHKIRKNDAYKADKNYEEYFSMYGKHVNIVPDAYQVFVPALDKSRDTMIEALEQSNKEQEENHRVMNTGISL